MVTTEAGPGKGHPVLGPLPAPLDSMTQAAQGNKCWRENQAPVPTTDAAGLAESLNTCGAEGKTGSPALGNEAGTHLKEEATSRIREGIPALQGEEEVKLEPS